MLAKFFVRKLLMKKACARPSAGQALQHPFLACDTAELIKLYNEIVMSSWMERDMTNTVVLKSIFPHHETIPLDDIVETASQRALAEMDGNFPEMKERKRLYVEGKENDSQSTEEEAQPKKKRRLIQE